MRNIKGKNDHKGKESASYHPQIQLFIFHSKFKCLVDTQTKIIWTVFSV